MANLPVREMVLYKHGVGFFVRQGEIEGDSADLTFRKDEINDVLKSLAVFDQAGGQILGIHYDTPMDREHRLKSSSVNVSKQHALHDLIGDLQGRLVTMKFEPTPGTIEAVDGRVIGVDRTAIEHHMPQIVLLDDDGETHVYSMDMLRKFKIKDAQSEHDLSYFLDTSMTEDDRRVVNLRLSEGAHDLVVYYVAPSPTWRVSYRLVAETEEGGSTGKALLQGWGLFDNRLEEDLNNVRVTLVAGQPISFIYDLYSSTIPERKTIKEESRTTGPIEYEAEHKPKKRVDREARLFDGAMTMMSAPTTNEFFEDSDISRDLARASTKVDSEGKATGETFQYQVTAPVSVKRGESALVPIIGSDVNYERELLYNGAKLANHPVAAIRFENSTGLTLERGPVTVVEDGDYKGEAILPFTKEDNQVYLPYAVELGITIREKQKDRSASYTLSVKDSYLIFQYYQIHETRFIIENQTNQDQTVTLEVEIDRDSELFDTRPPDAETINFRRWRVSTKAQNTTEFVCSERRMAQSQSSIKSLNYADLNTYLRSKWLSNDLYFELREILDQFAEKEEQYKKIAELTRERKEIYAKQEEIRKNLGALQPTGQEAELRNRILEQLESTQNRLDEIDSEIDTAQHEITQLEAKANSMMQTLGKTAE